MNNQALANDTTANKISYYHLAAFLILLPFDFFYSQLVMISFAIHTIIHLKKYRLRLVFSKPVLVVASLYILGLLGFLYSPDIKEAGNEATKQLAILLFPILLILNGLDLERYKYGLLKIFGFTCVGTILYLYIDAIHTLHYFHLPLSSLFTLAFMNHNFALPIGLHATYMSMYAALSLVSFLYFIHIANTFSQRVLYSFGIIILGAGLLQLSSRAVFISLLIIVNFVLPFFLLKGKRRIFFIITAFVFSAVVLFGIYYIDSFKVRYISELKGDLGKKSMNSEITEPRLLRWKAEMELISKRPVFGYGSGSEAGLLKEKFFEKQFFISYLQEFNSHSQYLSFLLKAGIVGLALYLYVLYFGLNQAWRKRDIIFMGFMLIIAIVSVSENILDVNKGIFFYSFFMPVFLLSYSKNSVPTEDESRQPGNL